MGKAERGPLPCSIRAQEGIDAGDATAMPEFCLWLAIGSGCFGAFAGGLLVLLMARLR
jgi:hypothetical protein